LLRRQSWGEATVPEAIWARTREAVGGDAATVEQAVRKILLDVRNEGDAAVLRYCAAFDGASYGTLRVEQDEIKAAYDLVDPAVVVALGNVALAALRRIEPHGLSLRHDGGRARPWHGRLLVPLYHPGPLAAVHRPLERQEGDWRRLGRLVRRLSPEATRPSKGVTVQRRATSHEERATSTRPRPRRDGTVSFS